MRVKWILKVWLGLFATVVLSAATPVDLEKAIQFPVEKYQLKNGLTVLLHRDTTIPAVSLQTWFRVGSKDEQVGLTGLAHFFEHMMFKGTKKYPKETWGRFLNSKGADLNAFTSSDYTGYYINAPAEHLKLLLDIESDRMRHLTMDEKEVRSEREVVKEERRMRYDDNIEGGIREAMAGLIFTKLPYRNLPIGSMKDLNSASMADLKAFYKQFYSPNNAVLVLAGAFDPAGAKDLIEELYGDLPREEIQRPAITPEPEQAKERRTTITREAQAPTVAVGYRLPDVMNPDHYAMDLLAIVLGQGQSSRLYKKMVYEKEMAVNTYAYSVGQTLAGEFLVYAGLKPRMSADRALTLMEGEVRQLREGLISQKELDKARNIVMKDYVDGLKRVSGRARLLASYEVLLGDYRRVFSDLKEYQKVTPEDIRRVARTYLQSRQRNIVIVNPRRPGGPA
ncbi:MAG: M16 family metallopeptidase [Bdellovibrionales bacterium]